MKQKFTAFILTLCIVGTSSISYAEESLFDVPKDENIPPAVAEETTNPKPETQAPTQPNPTPETVLPAPPTPETTTPTEGESVPPSGGSVLNQKVVKLILDSPNAFVDGKKVKLDTPAKSIDGRTFLPLKFIAENILETAPVYDASTKSITLTKDSKTAILTVGKKEALINGQKIMLESAPITSNGATLLPLRFFVDNFDMTISYDAPKKEITIKKVIGINNLPIAAIEFSKDRYVSGEKIEFTDKSTDPDGDAIVDKEWMTSLDFNKKGKDINELLKKAPAGEYVVKYRVQDAKGGWSEWIEKTLVLDPNLPPVINSVSLSKSSLGRGEYFDLSFDFTNEEWEKIVKEDWSYRHVNQGPSQALKVKPERIFSSGEFIISLTLTDEYGNVSTPFEKTVQVSDRIVQTQMNFLAENDKVNSTLENFDNKDYSKHFKNMDISFVDNEGKLIMSDSPENVYDYGILYEDMTNQDGRILTYHVNKIPSPRNSGAGVIIVVENLETVPVNFSLEKTGMVGPSTDPLAVGTKVLELHFTPNNAYGGYTIEPKQKSIVYDSRGSINWKPDHLVSMLSEYKTSGNVKITVYSVGPNTGLEHLNLLSYLPRDNHPRGTFFVTQRGVDFAVPGKEPTSIILGGGDSEWITGIDGITKETVVNRGNYGIEYKINMTPEEDTLVFLNARGGPFKGIVGWIDGYPRTVNSFWPSAATYVGKIPKGTTSTMRYMLPNGSSSPVILGFVPESEWNK